MTVLTLAAVEAGPWNAVELAWPADADRVFMEAAYRAAKRCPSRYRRPRIEDFPGDGAQSVEIRLCQDGTLLFGVQF